MLPPSVVCPVSAVRYISNHHAVDSNAESARGDRLGIGSRKKAAEDGNLEGWIWELDFPNWQ
jgi:hypothetical protein